MMQIQTIRLSDYTEQSQCCILRAIKDSEDRHFPYLEPQMLMSGIVNEGEELLLFVLQFVNADVIDFSEKVNRMIACIESIDDTRLIELSNSTITVLNKAKELSEEDNCKLIPLEHVLLSLVLVPSDVQTIFSELGIEANAVKRAIQSYRGDDVIDENEQTNPGDEQEDSILYDHNLCEDARNGRIHPAIGRDDVIRRVIRILSRRTKNNPILVGEPGIGKTAIVEGLACRINSGDAPLDFRSVAIISFDDFLDANLADGKCKDQLDSLLEKVSGSNGKIVLFIEEIHRYLDYGNAIDREISDALLEKLDDGEIRVIGTTTPEGYMNSISGDEYFEDMFQKVLVEEPDEDTALAILRNSRYCLENFYHIVITDEAIKAAVKLSKRYIPDRYLPKKAIDLLDEASAKMKNARTSPPVELDSLRKQIAVVESECYSRKKENGSFKRDNDSDPNIARLQEDIANLKEKEKLLLAKWKSEVRLLEEIGLLREENNRLNSEKQLAESKGVASLAHDYSSQITINQRRIDKLTQFIFDHALFKPALDESEVMSVITEWTGIPVPKLNESESDKLLQLEERLSLSVIGQEEAKRAVANAIRRSSLGFGDENRPIGSFLFFGTTGVGKTELCKVLSEVLFGSRDAMIRFDMSEYQEEHTVSKLFGSPPGFVGYEDGGRLTEAVFKKPYSLILFDEIEKAHPKVFETLLQVLDDGRMTDGKGKTVDFKNTIIVMTSNLGHKIIYSTLQGERCLQRSKIGFAIPDRETPVTTDDSVVTNEKIAETKERIFNELKTKVAPEFINRIDEIVLFLPLSKDDVKKIASLQITSFIDRMKQKGLTIIVDDSAIDFIVRVGFQPEYGARPIKRAINSFLIDDLSLNLLKGNISKDMPIYISGSQDCLTFTNQS